MVGEEKKIIHWDTDSHLMVEVEAFCKDGLNKKNPLTLYIVGNVPKFSELKRLLNILKSFIEGEGILSIYCTCPKTKKLLEFCGFTMLAKFLKEPPETLNYKEN